MSVIELQGVSKTYRQRRRTVTAVDDVSLALGKGEVLCVVGESGSGKSTIGRLVTGLTEPSLGTIAYNGRSTHELSRTQVRAERLKVQMVQQDPYASLNPGMTVAQALSAPLVRHFRLSRAETARRVAELLEAVGLTPATTFVDKFPHELSGGQRQRVSIARSLTVEPHVLVADEAVSMLDVSLRVSILAMLRDLCAERDLAVLFITHDLAVARQFAEGHSIAVMQRGRVIEHRPTQALLSDPQHPYTHALLAAARHESLRSRPSRDRVGARHKQVAAVTPDLHR